MASEFDTFATEFAAPSLVEVFGLRDGQGALDTINYNPPDDGNPVPLVGCILGVTAQQEADFESLVTSVGVLKSAVTTRLTIPALELMKTGTTIVINQSFDIDGETWPIRNIISQDPSFTVVELESPVEHEGPRAMRG